MKQTTKECKCGNTKLALMATLDKKVCPDCGKVIGWYKVDGQDSYYAQKSGK